MRVERSYKKIGQGLFTSVYRKGNADKVLLISTDPVKECMSFDWFPSTPLFPKVKRLSYNDDGTSTYEMKYYSKVRAPKQQLNNRGYKLYLALRELNRAPFGSNPYDFYSHWREEFKKLPNTFRVAQGHLVDAIDSLTNYGPDINFEISPRNIATRPNGGLVLLDCFFMPHKLEEIRK
jgi:hypothetical protein